MSAHGHVDGAVLLIEPEPLLAPLEDSSVLAFRRENTFDRADADGDGQHHYDYGDADCRHPRQDVPWVHVVSSSRALRGSVRFAPSGCRSMVPMSAWSTRDRFG